MGGAVNSEVIKENAYVPVHVGEEAFPILGIKLRNSGNATAVIWAIEVAVEDIKVDLSPVLKASLDHARNTKSPDLVIAVRDSGWGPKRKYVFNIREPLLEELFPQENLHFVSSVGTQEATYLQIKHADMRRGVFRDVLRREGGEDIPSFEREGLDKLFAAIRKSGNQKQLRDLTVDYETADNSEPEYRGTLMPRIDPDGGLVFVSASKFTVYPTLVAYCRMFPDTRYSAVMDVDQGCYAKTYKVSRAIRPGDPDYFQMELGATKSCTMRARLRIFIDNDQKIETQPFTVKVTNDRDAALHKRVIDGGEKILWPKGEKRPTCSRSSLDSLFR